MCIIATTIGELLYRIRAHGPWIFMQNFIDWHVWAIGEGMGYFLFVGFRTLIDKYVKINPSGHHQNSQDQTEHERLFL